jgi:uncharacterized protein (DUF433 family)
MTLQELQQQMLQLPISDRWYLVQTLLTSIQQDNDTWPGIEKTLGVCGGDARIASTRIPIWVLMQARNLGNSEAELLQNYPTLSASDLANAWAYATAHGHEIDQAIRENNEA